MTAAPETNRKLLRVLNGETLTPPPVWIMRQAGRYLPEYRATRAKAGGFLDLCYNPDFATEVTLQPIRRFGFDGAILFSDILVIPDAMGQPVRFEQGVGPRLEPLDGRDGVERLEVEPVVERLSPVIETVRQVRAALPDETTLLGFCGAPWTVATYMIAGRGTPDQAPSRVLAHREPETFQMLMDKLVTASQAYLIAQLRAGADAVQIFDTWGGIFDDEQFDRWVIAPTKAIIDGVRAEIPDARIIGFPRGAGLRTIRYVAETGVNAVGTDWMLPLDWARDNLQSRVAVQGNLDPTRLIAGGRALDEGIDRILEAFGQGPHIFNLGHGITPETPIAHVEQLLKRVRG